MTAPAPVAGLGVNVSRPGVTDAPAPATKVGEREATSSTAKTPPAPNPTRDPYYQDEHVTVLHGDCLDMLRHLPDASMHAVVTDPPYGLANTSPEQVADTIVRWVNGDRDYLPGGSGFMGKAWDAFVPPVAVWDECLRVLKPGGHVLAFAGSRTHDLMTLALRLAGFDIRDSIAWLYGSGFPKSLDVSKAIDKRPGVTRHAEFGKALRDAMTAKGYTNTFDVAEKVIGRRTGAVANWIKYQFPEAKWWPALRDLLDMDEDTWGPVIAEAERQKVGTKAGTRLAVAPGQGEDRSAIDLDVTTPATPDAARWQGWGTALKPAFEPIVVARKPLAGTVAANVLAHGTGALNIDACRVPTEDVLTGSGTPPLQYGGANSRPFHATAEPRGVTQHEGGRWPTNVVLDESQAAELDRQSGVLTSGKMQPTHTTAARRVYGQNAAGGYTTMETYGDSGGASRFFPTFHYEAKAPTDERPRAGDVAHPTVKPLDLMRWLVRLVTPPGGTVLEPFAGSGTTAEACVIEGFRCIAIEREADYLPLIRARLEKPIQTALDLGGAVS